LHINVIFEVIISSNYTENSNSQTVVNKQSISNYKIIAFCFILIISSSNLIAQTHLSLVNDKGRTLKKLRIGEMVYVKMLPGEFITMPLSDIDSIVRYDAYKGNISEKTFSASSLNSPINLKNYSARIMSISETGVKILPLSYDSLSNDDIRFWSVINYEFDHNEDASYKDIDLDKIRMLYVKPTWRNGFYTMTSILGISAMVTSPIFSVRDLDSPSATSNTSVIDATRLGVIAGSGLVLYLSSRFLRKQLIRKHGYYTTQKDDYDNISKRYKLINIVIK